MPIITIWILPQNFILQLLQLVVMRIAQNFGCGRESRNQRLLRGIIGMGESIEDRIGLIYMLARRNPHPESVPINLLIPVQGTPLQEQQFVPIWDMVRMIATARITMPKAMVRLSAGRLSDL